MPYTFAVPDIRGGTPDLSVIVHDSCCSHIRRLVNRGGVRHPSRRHWRADAPAPSRPRSRTRPARAPRPSRPAASPLRAATFLEPIPSLSFMTGASRPEGTATVNEAPGAIDTSSWLVACGRPFDVHKMYITVSVLPHGLGAMTTACAVIGSRRRRHRCLLKKGTVQNSIISFGTMFEPLQTTIYFELWISFEQSIDDLSHIVKGSSTVRTADYPKQRKNVLRKCLWSL